MKIKQKILLIALILGLASSLTLKKKENPPNTVTKTENAASVTQANDPVKTPEHTDPNAVDKSLNSPVHQPSGPVDSTKRIHADPAPNLDNLSSLTVEQIAQTQQMDGDKYKETVIHMFNPPLKDECLDLFNLFLSQRAKPNPKEGQEYKRHFAALALTITKNILCMTGFFNNAGLSAVKFKSLNEDNWTRMINELYQAVEEARHTYAVDKNPQSLSMQQIEEKVSKMDKIKFVDMIEEHITAVQLDRIYKLLLETGQNLNLDKKHLDNIHFFKKVTETHNLKDISNPCAAKKAKEENKTEHAEHSAAPPK